MAFDAPLRPLLNASVSTVHINGDGQRIAGDIGHDPSGVVSEQSTLEFTFTRVPFEASATWLVVDSVKS